MKASEVERAKMLVEAWDALSEIERHLVDPKSDNNGDPAFEVVACHHDLNGSSSEAYAYLPPEYGQRLMPAIRQMIREELESLGVELDA